MIINKLIFLFALIFLITACSKKIDNESLIKEKSLELQVLEAYEEGKESLEKGDVLFMHGLCVHESSDNNSRDSRPLLSLGYMPFGEKFDPGFNSKRRIDFLN